MRYMGSTATRNEQVHHIQAMLAEVTSEFKADQRSHTVAEKSEWHIQIRMENVRQRLNERREAGKGRLYQSALSSW